LPWRYGLSEMWQRGYMTARGGRSRARQAGLAWQPVSRAVTSNRVGHQHVERVVVFCVEDLTGVSIFEAVVLITEVSPSLVLHPVSLHGSQPETIADSALRRKESRRPASGVNGAASGARGTLISLEPRNPRLARISLDSENTRC
jgi:hypothetical protein